MLKYSDMKIQNMFKIVSTKIFGSSFKYFFDISKTYDYADVNVVLGIDMEKDTQICPVPYGGLLLFNNLTPHRR